MTDDAQKSPKTNVPMRLRDATRVVRRFWNNFNDGEFSRNMEPRKVLKVLFDETKRGKPTFFYPEGEVYSKRLIAVVECRDSKIRFMDTHSKQIGADDYGPEWDSILSFPRVCKIPRG